jgi:hypothetical protein
VFSKKQAETYINFSVEQEQAKKLSTDLILKTFKKYSSGDLIPLRHKQLNSSKPIQD